jgi:hypothetical protein
MWTPTTYYTIQYLRLPITGIGVSPINSITLKVMLQCWMFLVWSKWTPSNVYVEIPSIKQHHIEDNITVLEALEWSYITVNVMTNDVYMGALINSRKLTHIFHLLIILVIFMQQWIGSRLFLTNKCYLWISSQKNILLIIINIKIWIYPD